MPKSAAKSAPIRRANAPPTAAMSRVAGHETLAQIAAVFIVALLARGLHFLAMRDSPFFDVLVCDGRQYDAWARRIAGGQWIGAEVFYQTPLYPYFLSIVYAIAGHSVWAARVVQAILGSIACVFVARAGTTFFSNCVGWIAGLMLAVYPPAIFFDGIIQKASLDLVFMGALLWVSAEAQRRYRLFLLAIVGLLLAAMALNRENAVLLIPLYFAWVVWLTWTETRGAKLRSCLVMALGLGAILLPVGVRNYYVGGQFLLTTSQMGPNFFIGNHAGASGLYEPLRPGRGDPIFESQDARIIAEQELARTLTASEVSEYWMARSFHDIADNPTGWLRLLARKWTLTWNALELVDAEGIRAHQRDSWLLRLLGAGWHFGVLAPVAFAGIWLTRQDWRRLWLLHAILISFAAAVTLFFVFARYRYPLVPVLALFAAAGASGVFDIAWRRLGAMSELAVAGAIAVVAGIACNWGFPQLLNDEVSYITAANGFLDDQRPGEAFKMLKVAEKINPRSYIVYNNLGVVALKLDRFGDAESQFLQAIQLDPKNALAHQGLGEVYLRRGDRVAAEQQWRQAIQLDPLFAKAYRSLGSSKLATEDIESALQFLQRSLELEPVSVSARVDLALAYIGQGKIDAAQAELELALALTPQLREANNLAWILATAPDQKLRNESEALRLAKIACEATDFKEPDLLDTLAAAYAGVGDFANAQRSIEQALQKASKRGGNLVEALEQRRILYAAKQPYRDPQLAASKSALLKDAKKSGDVVP